MATNKFCSDCGREFILTDDEIAFLNMRKCNMPKRCKPCREKEGERRQKERDRRNSSNSIVAVKSAKGFPVTTNSNSEFVSPDYLFDPAVCDNAPRTQTASSSVTCYAVEDVLWYRNKRNKAIETLCVLNATTDKFWFRYDGVLKCAVYSEASDKLFSSKGALIAAENAEKDRVRTKLGVDAPEVFVETCENCMEGISGRCTELRRERCSDYRYSQPPTAIERETRPTSKDMWNAIYGDLKKH